MHRLRALRIALPVVLAVLTACATTSLSAANREGKISPPEHLRGGPPPQIREEVDLRIEVLVNADGQPDLRTLKVSGRGSGSAHAAIEDWIRSSSFKPAMQNGHPVAAVFRTGLKSRIEVRRG